MRTGRVVRVLFFNRVARLQVGRYHRGGSAPGAIQPPQSALASIDWWVPCVHFVGEAIATL